MRIAYYEAEYLEECAELLQKVYNNEQWGCHWSEIKSKKYIAELSQIPRFVGFLLLNDEEELIGAALCHERTWWYKDELFIDEFFIDPDSQQRGYGSKLLKYMTKYSKEQKLAYQYGWNAGVLMAECVLETWFPEYFERETN